MARGLSALDLYAMGMIPAEDVPDTFILQVAEGTEPRETVRATKVPVRIEDVDRGRWGRAPPRADESRKEFRLGVYLLHDGGAPRPALLPEGSGHLGRGSRVLLPGHGRSNADAAESELRTLVSATADGDVGVADGVGLRP